VKIKWEKSKKFKFISSISLSKHLENHFNAREKRLFDVTSKYVFILLIPHSFFSHTSFSYIYFLTAVASVEWILCELCIKVCGMKERKKHGSLLWKIYYNVAFSLPTLFRNLYLWLFSKFYEFPIWCCIAKI
jgi:hypothetical protein